MTKHAGLADAAFAAIPEEAKAFYREHAVAYTEWFNSPRPIEYGARRITPDPQIVKRIMDKSMRDFRDHILQMRDPKHWRYSGNGSSRKDPYR